uniref:C-type lectin domain-containing protein n=1 Tax=Nothobranchius korthausae TaxID=1143690 RepID=A0A1A8HD05_9TELE
MSIKALPTRLFSSYNTTVMEQTYKRANEFRHRLYKIFGQGGCSFVNYKVLNLCLGLLNVVLLIVAVALSANCAKIKKDSLQVYHSAALQLFSKRNDLCSNQSTGLEAEGTMQNYTKVKEQIHQLNLINDVYQRQLEALRAENTNLLANMSALGTTCSRCSSGWTQFNSSCYYFSPYETKTWIDSRADCIRRGSDLVVIDNQQEQMFVSHTIEMMELNTGVWRNAFWIGLTDMKVEGTWEWINNVTEVEPRYWMDMEPKQFFGEDCALAVYSADNPWKTRFDGSCKRQKFR